MKITQTVRRMIVRGPDGVRLSIHGRRDAARGLPNQDNPGYGAKIAAEDRVLQDACANDLAGRERGDLEKKAALVLELTHRVADEETVTAELSEIEAQHPVGAYPENDSVPRALREQRDRNARDRACAAKRAKLAQARARRQATEVLLERITERIEQRRVELGLRAAEYHDWMMTDRMAVWARANSRSRARRERKAMGRAGR